MTKRDFILNTIMRIAGPMLSAVDEMGENRYTESDILLKAESLALGVSDELIVSEPTVKEISEMIQKGIESINNAIEEHQYGNQDWCIIKSELDDAKEYFSKAKSLYYSMGVMFEDEE